MRRAARIGWRGGGYRPEIVLADVELDGDLAPGVAHVVAGRAGLVFVFARGECATWRLLATRPCTDPQLPFGRAGPPVPGPDLQRLLDEAGLPARVRGVGWSSRMRVQHRLADAYRCGPLILAGDAAHTHSPAAGQGMNTGIQDAVNLGWKLGFAPTSAHPEGLLCSYELERRPVARHVLALTHGVFWAEASTGPLASFVRAVLAPLAAPGLPLALRQHRLVAEVVRVLARFGEHYRTGPLSVDNAPPGAGGPRAGDRLPDATVITGDGRQTRLHALLAAPGVHLLVRARTPDAAVPAPGPLLHLHHLEAPSYPAVLAVRPDGHVGYRGPPGAPLRRWLADVGAPRGSR